MSTRNPRLKRLVASKRRAAASKAITAMNSAESPLLMLPPELRNRIYELVIGGHIIHVDEDWRAARFCSVGHDNASITAKYRANRDSHQFDFYFRYHYKCISKYNMPLLQVCRQINEETVLLPFATNTFKLNANNLSSFINRFHPVQRKAIKSLQLNFEPFTKLDVIKTKQLTGLRDLTIAAIGANHENRDTASQLMKLANGRLESVAVLITWIPPSLLSGSVRYDPYEWAARMEEQLLVRTSLTERNKMAAIELAKARAESKEASKAEKDRKKAQLAQASAATRASRGLRKLG